ncbi:hypothetical protein [Cryobacterium sp. M23]|uniref:hypothetical protein n=1 Tax=Cryobacterium sp. M23 TaxID=2048292 RepID=UPI0011B0C434|nr:hypothetical protein [Cryobacterium sp. M23]
MFASFDEASRNLNIARLLWPLTSDESQKGNNLGDQMGPVPYAHQQIQYPIASTTMDFNPDTAQMAFGLYLSLFIVFVLLKSVSGAGGVPMWILVLHYVTGFMAVFALMALVTIDITFTGLAGVMLWIASALITLLYFFSMLRSTMLLRRATHDSTHDAANVPIGENASANAAMAALVASSEGAAIAAASAAASAAAAAAVRAAAAVGATAAAATVAAAVPEPLTAH